MPEKVRRVIKDEELLSVFDGPPVDWQVEAYKVDWDVSDDTILATTEYTTSMIYDALGRVTKMTYPEDVDGERKILLPSYNRSGALESVQLKDTEMSSPVTYVDRIAYNARGQKILTALGNGIMTRYLYRSDNFRLLRMKSEKYEKITAGNTVTYEKQSGTIKQNFTYEYDLSGNIISITDTTTGCGVAGTDELVREFEYDALYRLLSATGRETAGTATKPWQDRYRPTDNTQSRSYTQYYEYDKLGNIQELQHVATGGNFTRTFNYISGKNKLNTIEIGANTYTFSHDVNGNIIQEDTNRHFTYDYADRLKAFYMQTSTEEPSQYTQYFYDAGGNRVKKISRVQGGSSTKTTIYIDGIFEHTITDTTGAIPDLEIGPWVIGYEGGEQNTLHIMDGSSRVATRRIGDAMDDTTPDIKYNLEDHLGSSNLLLDTNGVLVSKEEYYPFGETSFGSYGKTRYRFCGKEKDEESGLYYYGLRYYNPWTCRFINLDPLAAKYPFYTPYQYAGNQPINFIDLDGAEQATTEKTNDANKAKTANMLNNTSERTEYGDGLAPKVDQEKDNTKKVSNVFEKASDRTEENSSVSKIDSNTQGTGTVIENNQEITFKIDVFNPTESMIPIKEEGKDGLTFANNEFGDEILNPRTLNFTYNVTKNSLDVHYSPDLLSHNVTSTLWSDIEETKYNIGANRTENGFIIYGTVGEDKETNFSISVTNNLEGPNNLIFDVRIFNSSSEVSFHNLNEKHAVRIIASSDFKVDPKQDAIIGALPMDYYSSKQMTTTNSQIGSTPQRAKMQTKVN